MTLLNRLLVIKMRRLVELLVLSCFFIVILTICSKWSSTTINDNGKEYLIVKINNTPSNLLSQQDQIIDGQPDLQKYIHLDLKGAPPQANKFYETFFSFVKQLQMGVKGILIEYEDMLPLEGRFSNVN